ncbi:efflux transporter, RND family, MFP subunit [hydrothermal vent metagenome]|uniref:Efflux transporter, RND family, MFP subunit n=1 Tax=hydrothermal vent metagenome TaxID=652676 RepID=A0A1W1C5K6_9ZZZZ
MKSLLKVGLVLLVVAGLAILGIKKIKDKRAKEASTPIAKIYPIIAKSIEPKSSQVKLTLPYLAIGENESDVTLSSRIASRVEEMIQSGASVKKGEVIARLDTTEIKSNIKALKVSLLNLQKSHKRTQALYRVKGASIEQLQKEQSQIAELKAKIESLKNQLSYATLISPIDGVVTKVLLAVGDIAMPGKPMVQISANSGFSLLVRTPEEIRPKAVMYNEKEYKLNALNSTYHGLKEYKAYLNEAKGLTSGERVEVEVVVFEGQGILLPFDAILNRNGESEVLVVDGKHATPKKVTILQSAEQGVIVEDDLSSLKIVIAKPDILLKLTSGYALKVKE